MSSVKPPFLLAIITFLDGCEALFFREFLVPEMSFASSYSANRFLEATKIF
jgi:hypothetical protein